LNNATCDVYSPKAVENMLQILDLYCLKYIFWGFIEALDSNKFLNKLRIDGMH